jgi:cytochrome c biogenesis protein
LIRIRSRWRKTGEYLIHSGFIFLTVAYSWNAVDGFRTGPHPIYPGEEFNLEQMPDYKIKLESFTPQLSETGRPLDMFNEVSLWQGDTELKRAQIRINHPLTFEGLVILPTSFGRSLNGFRFHMPGKGMIDLTGGSVLALPNGGTFQALSLLPHVVKSRNGQIIPAGDQVRNPAMEVLIKYPDGRDWHGWYVLRERIPQPMVEAGLFIRPVEPIMKTYSLITINRDPGSSVALIGAIFMCLGVFLAFFSFYAKRARGDRPEY